MYTHSTARARLFPRAFLVSVALLIAAPAWAAPPRISGSPARTIRVDYAYNFQPTASDPDTPRHRLRFSISNRPRWASFSRTTGRLSGTPGRSHVGAYSNIRISVSDGRSSARAPAFAITVTEVANGVATLSWLPPTQNTNGSALRNLAGYRIYYGTSATALNRTVTIANAGVATYIIDNLPTGAWHFAVCAYNANGIESPLSNRVSKTIR